MRNVKPGQSKPIVCLDAGHYGKYNRSPAVPEYYESEMNWKLHNYLATELEGYGIQVKKTRTEQAKDLELYPRGAASKGCDLFLSIHSNAPGSATSPEAYHAVRGSEVYYSLADEPRNAEIARALNAAVVTTMNTTDRGIKTRSYPDQPEIDYYGVLRHSAAYGCPTAFIIEHGFHTNPEDAAFLTNDECLQRLAEAEAEVIDRVL